MTYHRRSSFLFCLRHYSLRIDLLDRLKDTRLPVMDIRELQDIAYKMSGKPESVETSDEVVAVIEYRDGGIIDVVRKPL